MADTLKVEIVSAEQSIFSGEATMVTASALLGEVGIAPGHTPFISRIKPGEVRVTTADDSEELDIYVSGGLLEVQPYVVTILADTALRIDEIDESAAQKAKEEAEAELAANKPEDIDYEAIQAQLVEASAKLRLVEKLRRR